MALIQSKEELLAAAREHGLRLVPERSDVDETGADFRVLHAVDEQGTSWVVRSPRRPDVLERAAVERRALELVRPRLPVAVPDWRVFSPDLIAYPRLPGHPAAVIDLSAGGYVWRFDETAPPAPFLQTLADALAALHRIGPEAAAAAGLPILPPATIRDQFARRMERSREVLEVPPPVWERWHRWLGDESYWPEHSVLVHGDLHPAHLLVDGAHRVTGLLDWTEAHVGDPATDFALQFATLGGETLSALLEQYAAGGGRVWPRMRDHVIETWSAYPAVVAEFALLTGEEAHRQLGQYLVDANAREIAERRAGECAGR